MDMYRTILAGIVVAGVCSVVGLINKNVRGSALKGLNKVKDKIQRIFYTQDHIDILFDNDQITDDRYLKLSNEVLDLRREVRELKEMCTYLGAAVVGVHPSDYLFSGTEVQVRFMSKCRTSYDNKVTKGLPSYFNEVYQENPLSWNKEPVKIKEGESL